MKMYEYTGEQDDYFKIGKAGCYFLCLCRIGQEFVRKRTGTDYEVDLVSTYRAAKQKGFLEDNCFVKNASGILNLVTGERWWVERSTEIAHPNFEDRKYIDTIINLPNNAGGSHFTHKIYEPLRNRFKNEPYGYRHLYVYKQNLGAGAKTIINRGK